MGIEYKPGQKVEFSGIYAVNHDTEHEYHEVTVIKGSIFPPCKHPRFVLKYKAEHIKDDKDFEIQKVNLLKKLEFKNSIPLL